MKYKTLSITWIYLLFGCQTAEVSDPYLNPSGAGYAMDAWMYERSYPAKNIPIHAYEMAFYQSKNKQSLRKNKQEQWVSLGPQNIGGRTLCMAFHPSDANTIYAGTAGGGLWQSKSQGKGPNAWEHIPTGHPVHGVGAIHINPKDPNIILIGTGECYNTIGKAEPGIINRYTRGGYGIGILRSKDGGATWEKSLSFDQDQIVGVSDFAYSRQDHNIIMAATSIGAFRSTDGGITWSQVFSDDISIDIEINHDNDSMIIMSTGGLNINRDRNRSGIYVSIDGGKTFSKSSHAELPLSWSGNAKLEIDPQNNNVVWASIQNYFEEDLTTPLGLYKSTDFGSTWRHINNTNVALWQGWYSHDIAIHPTYTDEMIYVGIDTWKSSNSGKILLQQSNWNLWTIGAPEEENNPKYVHADIHAVYYHPLEHNKVFLATDGGIFLSEDRGDTFNAINSGLQIAQFYPNVSTSSTDPDYMIGGTQDNGIWKYDNNEWTRVLGGDGTYTAIDPTDDTYSYASQQFLFISRSRDRLKTFDNIRQPQLQTPEKTAFLAPFEIAPSSPNRLYAGRQRLYNSTDRGFSWTPVGSGTIDGSSVIINIAISHQKHRTLYVSTAPDPSTGIGTPKLWKTENGGVSWTQMKSLPDRVIKDIAFDPHDDQVAYVVFSGYNSDHMAKTADGGVSWQLIDGLPNVPTNTVLIDPKNTNHVYIGNDIGVFFSEDKGESWTHLDEGFTDAIMVMHLHISPANRKLRVATHGRGIYERNLIHEVAVSTENILADSSQISLYPNPADQYIKVNLPPHVSSDIRLRVLSMDGKQVITKKIRSYAGQDAIRLDVHSIPAGQYILQLIQDKSIKSGHFTIVR